MDKYMGRKIFEAGARKFFSDARRSETRSRRRRARAYFSSLKFADKSAYDDVDYVDSSFREWREQDIYLNPLKNWLRSHVGQSWNEVRSKISAVAKKKSFHGDAIWSYLNVVEHKEPKTYRYGFGFWVDDDGILREYEQVIWSRHPKRDVAEAKEWVGVIRVEIPRGIRPIWKTRYYYDSAEKEVQEYYPRRVLAYADKAYWMIQTPNETNACNNYRQSQKLTDEEFETFMSFSEKSRKIISWTKDDG